MRTPAWMKMTSEFVAEQIIKVAKRPRRKLILPWSFGIIIWFNDHFPRISDWLQIQFAKKYHIV